MHRPAALLPLAAIALASCGTSTIKPEGAAQSVVDVVSQKTGFHPKDVKCPDGVEAKVGQTFDCHFTGPDGRYVAHLRITKIEGSRVNFFVRSVPDRGGR